MAAELLIDYAGLDVNSDHGRETPKRFLDMLNELTQCRPRDHATNQQHMVDCIKWKTFPAKSDGMVVQGPIPFVSVCNHHVLPFHGYAYIGYVPNVEVVGLSKLARVVHHFSRKLQIQEELTDEIASFLDDHLVPKGTAVTIRGEHTCMTFRGVGTPGVLTTTTVVTGVFADHNLTAKAEYLAEIGRMVK